MKLVQLDHLWNVRGWLSPAFIRIDDTGTVVAVADRCEPDEVPSEHVRGYALPGMPNLHSHAFQRAMAGLGEHGAGRAQSFWTWRNVMYQIALRVSPDDIEAIAGQLYVEMLKAGYTSVAEFHYLHRDVTGALYADPAELSLRIARAADKSGIGLTWLGVLYQHGGFGGQAASEEQRRFLLSVDELLEIACRLRTQVPRVRVGVAPHSLRAASAEAIAELLSGLDDETAPVHIHIAEQAREVDECLAWCGARPVQHLFDRLEISRRFCLVHATHVSDAEIDAIAASGAVVGLCPTTEANLGDGVFPLERLQRNDGRFGIGSDSHVSVNATEELRWLEYGQRLVAQRRNITGGAERLWDAALKGGAMALGQLIGDIEPGARADLIVLDPDHPALAERPRERILDAFVFATSSLTPVRDVMVGGHWVVENGRHVAEEETLRAFRAALRRLR